jgi:Domain of unknown function (DUF4404)
MDNKVDRNLLQELHKEINSTQAVDDKGMELLRDLDEDIHALLERSQENSLDLHPSIVQRMEATLNHFEVTHPNLTTMISKILSGLSNAGI